MSSIRFPGETASYREARDTLLKAEIELKKSVEAVAALRRGLPLGGQVPEDYVFDEGPADLATDTPVHQVRLSELFGDKDTLVLYSYMYGPAMKTPCVMCTSFLDGLEAQADHIRQGAALAITAKSPIARVREFARGRGWNRLRILSSSNSTYQLDYYGESESGGQSPMMNVFARRGGVTYHFWGSEMLYAKSDDGLDSRHIDMLWPLWNVLDLTPAGRGGKWYPALAYDKA